MNITDEELLMLEHLIYLNEGVATKADDLGDDSLRGGEGDDTIYDGNDGSHIYDGTGNDRIFAGVGIFLRFTD